MLINTNALKGIIAERQTTGAKVAKELGITPKTFYEKMKKGVFGSDEIDAMIQLLNIEDPMSVFFAPRT